MGAILSIICFNDVIAEIAVKFNKDIYIHRLKLSQGRHFYRPINFSSKLKTNFMDGLLRTQKYTNFIGKLRNLEFVKKSIWKKKDKRSNALPLLQLREFRITAFMRVWIPVRILENLNFSAVNYECREYLIFPTLI